MYSFTVFQKLKEELNLELLEYYNENDKYISTTKFCMKCNFNGCDTPISIQFVALLRNKKPYCKTHRYCCGGENISKSLYAKNKQIYHENRNKLYKLFQELGVKFIGDYTNIDIKNDTDICYICCYDGCNETCTKQYHALIKNKLAYCNEHHVLLHNKKINEKLRKQNQETYNKYNDMLDNLKEKYTQVNLSWNRDTIWSQAEMTFNCINPNCKSLVCKLFQHILQNEEIINEVYFACNDCKYHISESLHENVILLINTPYYNELIEYPKQINYITTHSSINLKWSCGNNCINCNNKHIYESSPHYRFVQWGFECPLCLEPNKCHCVNDGFICNTCSKYFPNKEYKSSNGNICIICRSSENDDNLAKIFKRKIHNCISICKNRKGHRGNMNLDIEYLQQLYQEQNGLCYVSKIEMSLKVHSNFQISIERIDETNGYVKGNIKFICLEFQNGFQQWTPNKFNEFCINYYTCQTITETDKENVKKKYNEAFVKNTNPYKDRTIKRKSQQKAYNNIEKQECLCRTCDTIKFYENFSEHGIKKGICKECVKKINYKYRNTRLRCKLKTLISGSKNGIKKRNKSKWRKEVPLIHTLTFEELLDIYLLQSGRCAYSNKLLELSGQYMMSLERKNTNIGYIKENCCLICIEFNTTDWSITKCDYDNREGSSGWNKAKIQFVVDNYLRKN
jgi:hypothetical protein